MTAAPRGCTVALHTYTCLYRVDWYDHLPNALSARLQPLQGRVFVLARASNDGVQAIPIWKVRVCLKGVAG